MKQLEGKVALITGAGSGGTGTAMSVRFAAEGAKVALVARNEEGLSAPRRGSGTWAVKPSSCPATSVTPTAVGRP